MRCCPLPFPMAPDPPFIDPRGVHVGAMIGKGQEKEKKQRYKERVQWSVATVVVILATVVRTYF